LLAAVFGVDLRVAVAEPVLLLIDRFAFPRLLADFLVARRLVAAATERVDLPRFVLALLDVAFFLVERLFPR
jgi:hypothetical protein